MEDFKTLTACAECSWGYIDRLRMAFAATCKERDELKASDKQVTEALQRNGFHSFEELIASVNQVKNERDAAVKCLNDIRLACVCGRSIYVVEDYLKKLRDEVGI